MRTYLLEALDEAGAIKHLSKLTGKKSPLTETDVRDLHWLIMRPEGSADGGEYAYSSAIPALMRGFANWLSTAPDTPKTAFEAHRRLMIVHPFANGNRRTAKMLMHVILIRAGFPIQDQQDYFKERLRVHAQEQPDIMRVREQLLEIGGE